MSVNQAVVFTKPVHHLGTDLTPAMLDERARSFFEEKGWPVIAVTESPITGQKGNREFLIHCVDSRYGKPVEEETLRQIVLN